MSEIFAPGSIAGPPATFMGPHNSGTSYSIGTAVSSEGSSYVSLVNSNIGNTPSTSPTQWALLAAGGTNGTNGTNGAAGSAAAVSVLAGALMPNFVGRNLFDVTRVTAGFYPLAADGTLGTNGSVSASALIYCPGATSMIANIAVDTGRWGPEAVCLYDANGTFLSALAAGAFTSLANGGCAVGSSAFTLPGTQAYVRFGYVPSFAGGYNWAAESAGMVYATVTGTATLPGVYAPSGMASLSVVTEAVSGMAASNLAFVTSAVANLAAFVLPVNGNRFDPSMAQVGYQANPDGTVSVSTLPGSPIVSGMIYCPGATTLLPNLAIYNASVTTTGIQLFDANGLFQGVAAYDPGGWHGNAFAPITIPGTQTFVRVTFTSDAGSSQGPLPGRGMVYVGSATSVAPMSSLTRFTPFVGGPIVNPFKRESVMKASDLGCGLTCDFNNPDINSGNGLTSADVVATNDTTLLNAFLATASETNPIKLIIDGCAYVTGLVISPAGYTTIEGIGRGSGIYMMNGSNQDAIRIGPYIAAVGSSEGPANGTPGVRPATKIALRNFTVNNNNGGNSSVGGTYAPAGSPAVGDAAHTLFATILEGCTDVVVENMNYINSPWFNLTFANSSNIRVSGCEFASTGYGRDGIHIDGPCEDITISDCAFSTGDDAIALNAPEGYGGDISRVTVTNCRFLNALTVMRIYTSVTSAASPNTIAHQVRNVVVSNCSGIVTSVVFNLGITNGFSSVSTVDQIEDFSVSNCSFVSPQGLALLLVPIGSIRFHDVTFIPAGATPVISVMYPSVGEIELSGLRVVRNPAGNAAPASVVWVYSGANLDRVSILNFAVIDEEGSSYAAVPCIVDALGAIAALRLEGVDMTHVTALVSSAGWGGVTALRGNGVAGTGIAVPDSVMDNNALYLSSTAGGAPSIKVGGVAKRLSFD